MMPSLRKIRYVRGDATHPETEDGVRVIVHICNDAGGWGSGFVLAVDKLSVIPRAVYHTHKRYKERPDGLLELGTVQLVKVKVNLWVANLIGQHMHRTANGDPPIRYNAVRLGLMRLAEQVLLSNEPVSIHMPRIGCGLGGGKWEFIEHIISQELSAKGIPVTVYDLPMEQTDMTVDRKRPRAKLA
jgi:O-acetyl-ADP-ribose deacetylase (regulator of RNase III)